MATGARRRGGVLEAVARVPGATADAGRRLADDPLDWLPGGTRRRGPDRWAARVHAGPAARNVTCEVGAVWRRGDEVWRHLRWRPDEGDVPPAAALPGFTGEVGVVADDDGIAVVVRGRPRLPAGALGAAADAAVLHRVGQATVARFARDVAARLSAARDDRPAVPGAPGG